MGHERGGSMIGLLGMGVILGLAWALSVNRRRAFNPRILAWGLGLPIVMAVVTLRTPIGARFFIAANDTADAFIGFADAGIRFVFGDWPRLVAVSTPAPDGTFTSVTVGFLFAVKVLPIIIFIASVMAVLYHLGIMQRVVALLARALSRLMNISSAEALSTVGDVFLGMTEAPLLIRPYVARMTQSELFAVMTAGMATIAGSVLVAYKAMGIDAGFLVTASFMNAPLAVLIAKIMVPETETPETMGAVRLAVPRIDVNVFDAAARGASEGLQLALNVGAMLIAFVAFTFMADRGVSAVGGWFGHPELRLADLLGYPLAPLAWVMGVPWKDAPFVGSLLGIKTVLNEFLAYQQLAAHAQSLDPRTVRIASFGLCGFANFGSLAIVLGGLGVMVPERRPDLARFGLKAIIAGSLATFLSGTIAGLVGG
jgi:CNT family concentrative nucleoside transporter